MLGLFQSDKFLVMLETLFLPSYSFSRAMSSLSSQNGGGRAGFMYVLLLPAVVEKFTE